VTFANVPINDERNLPAGSLLVSDSHLLFKELCEYNATRPLTYKVCGTTSRLLCYLRHVFLACGFLCRQAALLKLYLPRICVKIASNVPLTESDGSASTKIQFLEFSGRLVVELSNDLIESSGTLISFNAIDVKSLPIVLVFDNNVGSVDTFGSEIKTSSDKESCQDCIH